MFKFIKTTLLMTVVLCSFSCVVLAQDSTLNSEVGVSSTSLKSVEVPNTRVGIEPNKYFTVSLPEIIDLALSHSLDISIEKKNTDIAKNNVRAAKGAYSLDFDIFFQYSKQGFPISISTSRPKEEQVIANLTLGRYDYNGTISRQMSNGGLFKITFNNSRVQTDESFDFLELAYRSTFETSFRQPLLRDCKYNSDWRTIHTRQKLVDLSDLKVQQKATNLVAQVQAAYYELVFAIKNEGVCREALKLAVEQLQRNQTRIFAGTAAPIEAISSQAQVELRKDDVISSLTAITKAENDLKKLILDDPTSVLWHYAIIPIDDLGFSYQPIKLEDAIATALKQRIELKQLEVENAVSDIGITFYKNQLKPQVDVFGGFIGQGLIGRQNTNGLRTNEIIIGNYFEGLLNVFRFRTYQVGAVINLKPANTEAKANLGREFTVKRQIRTRKEQQMQNIVKEVRDAVQKVEAAAAKVEAFSVVAQAAEVQLESELAKYDSSLSTNFIVLERQNELTLARGNRLRAITDYKKSLSELSFVMGDNLKKFH